MATILVLARSAPCVTRRRSVSGKRRSSMVGPSLRTRSIVGDQAAFSAARFRSVGISVSPGKSRPVRDSADRSSHGARRTSSSRSSAHCLASAWAQKPASLSVSAGRLALSAANSAAASLASAASRFTWAHASASVTGLASAADSSAVSNCSSCGTVSGAAVPTASTRIENVSLTPSSHRRLRMGASISAVSPGRKVSR